VDEELDQRDNQGDFGFTLEDPRETKSDQENGGVVVVVSSSSSAEEITRHVEATSELVENLEGRNTDRSNNG
jgi:DNA recombination-dependent growth factor C